MYKSNKKKLQLNRETVRTLDVLAEKRVRGGISWDLGPILVSVTGYTNDAVSDCVGCVGPLGTSLGLTNSFAQGECDSWGSWVD